MATAIACSGTTPVDDDVIPCREPGDTACPADPCCDFPDDRCGAGEKRTSAPIALGAASGRSSCACDGTVSPTACQAYQAGMDLDTSDACTA